MTQKLLVASDIHDDLEALVKFVEFAEAREVDHMLLLGDLSLRPYSTQDLQILRAQQTEQGIPKGAVYSFLQAKNRTNGITLNLMKGIMDRPGIPYHVIPGNYDGSLEAIFGQKDLHLKTTRLGAAKVAGYGGADAWPRHIKLLVDLRQLRLVPDQIIHFDHQQLYDFLVQERPAIGIIHNPPHKLCDDMHDGQNVSTPATAVYIQQHQPKLVLSGHIHEAGPNGHTNNPHGVAGINDSFNAGKRTVVVNPGNLGRFEVIRPQSLKAEQSFDHGTFSEVHIEADGTPKRVIHYSLQPAREFRQPLATQQRHTGPVRKLAEYAL